MLHVIRSSSKNIKILFHSHPDFNIPCGKKEEYFLDDALEMLNKIRTNEHLHYFGFVKFSVVYPEHILPFLPFHLPQRSAVYSVCRECSIQSKLKNENILLTCKRGHSSQLRKFTYTTYLDDLNFLLDNLNVEYLEVHQLTLFERNQCEDLKSFSRQLYQLKTKSRNRFDKCFLKIIGLQGLGRFALGMYLFNLSFILITSNLEKPTNPEFY